MHYIQIQSQRHGGSKSQLISANLMKGAKKRDIWGHWVPKVLHERNCWWLKKYSAVNWSSFQLTVHEEILLWKHPLWGKGSEFQINKWANQVTKWWGTTVSKAWHGPLSSKWNQVQMSLWNSWWLKSRLVNGASLVSSGSLPRLSPPMALGRGLSMKLHN